jgi:hypothetical protein
MDLDYFLFLEKEYNKISLHLDEIIASYETLIAYTTEQQNKTNTFEVNEMIDTLNFKHHQYLLQKNRLLHCLNNYRENMKNICVHNYISDLIDLSPERSEIIQYCTLCGNTKK